MNVISMQHHSLPHLVLLFVGLATFLLITCGGMAAPLNQPEAGLPQRVVQVDLDYVYDADPAQLDKNMEALVARIHDLHISTVYLQAFADPSGSGLASALYFPNRVLPMRADLFSRVATQLKIQANVEIYAWLPVLSFDLGSNVTPVMAWDPQSRTSAPMDRGYRRASPFDPTVRRLIGAIYEDLANQSPIDGILFHDDALLSDFEDASPAALGAYRAAHLAGSVDILRGNPIRFDKWTTFKTQSLIDFTLALAARVRNRHPELATVRNIYASPVLNTHSEEWYAQSYGDFLKAYTYVAIEAMPDMENVPEEDQDDWLEGLVKSADAFAPDALQRTIFELQSVDWRKEKQGEDRAIPAGKLADQMRLLAHHGAINFGYYPDDFKTNTPDTDTIRDEMALP